MDTTDWSALFTALGDVHRRRLLLSVLETERRDSVVQVPEDVHAGDCELEVLQVELFHNHIPMLAEVGYVTWNRENHEVRGGPSFERIAPVLELLDAHRDELPGEMV